MFLFNNFPISITALLHDKNSGKSNITASCSWSAIQPNFVFGRFSIFLRVNETYCTYYPMAKYDIKNGKWILRDRFE